MRPAGQVDINRGEVVAIQPLRISGIWVMRKTIIALAMLWAMIGQASADKLDTLLKNRETMVAAVALLLTLPPSCTIDNKRPSDDLIGLFVISYGHKPDDNFLRDVKDKVATQNEALKFPEPERSKTLEVMCAFSVAVTAKVRDVARLHGKLY